MDFIAIDFETASSKHSSPCSLGIAIVKEGSIVDCRSYLINPETDFSPYNIAIHGIHPEDVENAPTFKTLWPEIASLFENYPIVAHNAPFERSVIEKTAARYGIELPTLTFYCTLELCRENYTYERYTLDSICAKLGIDLCSHHSCDSDSVACAEIMLRILSDKRVVVHENSSYTTPKSKPTNYTTVGSGHIADLNRFAIPNLIYERNIDFAGKNVVITGEIPGYTRAEIIDYISSCGGVCKSAVSKKTHFVIVGLENRELTSDKENGKSSKILKAEEFIALGFNISFVHAATMLKLLSQQEN